MFYTLVIFETVAMSITSLRHMNIPIDTSPMPRRRGRGASHNPATPYEPLHHVYDPAELDEDELRQIPTQYFRDTTRSILSKNTSPDIPFTYSINPYRGCEHGCVYCYARPSHEYLGFSAGLDFETKILVKERAPQLLSDAFQKSSWRPQVVILSGNTDAFQPLERKLEISRGCLKVFLKHRNPVGIITKNGLVARDIDILAPLAELNLVRVTVSVTSLRPEITSRMEPRTANPALRLKTIERLAEAGVPVGVNVAPIVPGLTDEEMGDILKAAASAGATTAGFTVMRLPGAVSELFVDWIVREFPDRAQKVLRRVRSLRGDRLNVPRFSSRMRGEGIWAETLAQLFRLTCEKLELNKDRRPLSTQHFRRLTGGQMDLF